MDDDLLALAPHAHCDWLDVVVVGYTPGFAYLGAPQVVRLFLFAHAAIASDDVVSCFA